MWPRNNENIFSTIISQLLGRWRLAVYSDATAHSAHQLQCLVRGWELTSWNPSDLDFTSFFMKTACTTASLSSVEGKRTASSGMIWDHWPINEGLLEDKIFLSSKYSQRNMHPEGVIIRTLFPSPDTYK